MAEMTISPIDHCDTRSATPLVSETLNETVNRWAQQVSEPNSYPPSLFAPLVMAVEGRMRGRVYRGALAPLGEVDKALSEALQIIRGGQSGEELSGALVHVQAAVHVMGKLIEEVDQLSRKRISG